MGTWNRSFSFRGDVRSELVACLDRWLTAKGFERLVGADFHPLEPDSRGERGAFVLWNQEWTVLTYDAFDEEERLALELDGLGRPYLRFFVCDSDVWGYELRGGGEVLSAFASNPGVYEDLPDGPNDLEALVSELGLECTVSELGRTQRQRSVFAEGPAHRFLAAIGLQAAGTQYDYLQAGEPPAPGFERLALRYRRPGFDPMAGFELHRIVPRRADDTPETDTALGVPPGLKLLSLTMRAVAGMLHLLFWAFGPLLRWRLRRRAESKITLAPAETDGPMLRGNILEDRRLGFALTLPDGVNEPSGHRLFGWQGIDVSISVEGTERVRMRLGSSAAGTQELRDNFWVGPLAATSVLHERNGNDGRLLRAITLYVASDRGVYVFGCHTTHQGQTPTREQLQAVIEVLSTFRLLEPATAQSPPGGTPSA